MPNISKSNSSSLADLINQSGSGDSVKPPEATNSNKTVAVPPNKPGNYRDKNEIPQAAKKRSSLPVFVPLFRRRSSTSHIPQPNFHRNTIKPETYNNHAFNCDLKLDILNKSIVALETKIHAENQPILSALCDQVKQFESELEELRQENAELNEQLEYFLRRQYLCDVIVGGLPEIPDENPIEVANKIAEKLNFQLSPRVNAYRLPSKNGKSKRLLLIQLSSPDERRNLCSAFIANDGLTLGQFYDDNDNSRIFLNERLTPKNKDVLRTAVLLKQEGLLFSVRTEDGFVLVKKSSDDTEIKIEEKTFKIRSKV